MPLPKGLQGRDTGCSPQHSVWDVVSEISKASRCWPATCVGLNMGHGSKCWCCPCTPERHSRAEAAGGLSRHFLAHARLTKNSPPSFSRADARNRPRAHRSIMLEYNFASYFALLPFGFVDKLSSFEFTALQGAVRACSHRKAARFAVNA